MAVTEERMPPDIHLALHREGSITRPAMGHKRGPLNHDSRPLRVEFFFSVLLVPLDQFLSRSWVLAATMK